jgi:hypothetical protein
MGMKDSNYFDPRDHEAFVREIDSAAYPTAIGPGMLPKGAIPKRRGMTMAQHLSSNNVIAQVGIPFLIMPGDGSANGCQFTGSGGAFTLSAPILANLGASLVGCYAHFSASFGGSSLPAGWYWTEFSSDTAGIVYAETYTSGKASRPATKTAITPNLSGWVTATTNEVVGPQGFVLPGTALGKNGNLQIFVGQSGSTSGNKTFRSYVDTTAVSMTGLSTSPNVDTLHLVTCADSTTEKHLGRTLTTGPTGVGIAGTSYSSTNYVSVDTSIQQSMSVSLQGSTNVAAPVLLRALITATYGE